MAKALGDVIAACNAMFTAVSGIKRVFTYAPNIAPSGSGDLPCVIPVLVRCTGTAQAGGYLRKDYELKFLMLISAYSKDLASMDAQAQGFLDTTIEQFFQHMQLGDSANITHLGHAHEEPLIEMDYGQITYGDQGNPYLGYTVLVRVTVKKALDQGV